MDDWESKDLRAFSADEFAAAIGRAARRGAQDAIEVLPALDTIALMDTLLGHGTYREFHVKHFKDAYAAGRRHMEYLLAEIAAQEKAKRARRERLGNPRYTGGGL